MSVEYRVNTAITTDQFIDVLTRSTLGERRPINDRECMEGMMANSNLTVSAWYQDILVGIARSVTDFHYVCYVSDLAVCQSFQRIGIGRQLQIVTQSQLGPRCKLVLIAAPAVDAYYERMGFTNTPRCWVLDRDASIGS